MGVLNPPTSARPSGSAGGVLSGSYPNPGFAAAVGGVGAILGGKLTGANFNSTADQAITISAPSSSYNIFRIVVANPSATFAGGLAVGAIYTAASKGGAPVVPTTTVYTGLTTNTPNTAGSAMVLAGTNTNFLTLTATTLYLSLTTANGSAVTADIYIYICPMP